MTFIVIANFKSNKTQSEVKEWLSIVTPTPNTVVAPSYLTISLIHALQPSISIAAQDVSPFPPGAYTGGVNAKQLKDLGVSYAIVGHAERRRYFHESAMDVAGKVRELVSSGLTPVVCMEQDDIGPQFAALDDEYYSKCLYCFEPSQDIGGTESAPAELISGVKTQIEQYVGTGRFMYGGSVNERNISSLLPLDLAGVIVSTACLDAHQFNSILAKVS